MRASFAVGPLLLFAATIAVAGSPKVGFESVRCPKPTDVREKATFKRLGDLPPAEAFFAVLRSSDCPARVVQARDRLGTFPKPRR